MKGRPVLTTEVALRLRDQGVSTIELVWWWRRMRMTVTTGFRSVWGDEGIPLAGTVSGSEEELPAA